MIIRNLEIEEYEDMIGLWQESGLPYKPKGRDSKNNVSKQMARNPDLFLGAFDDNELVGCVIGSFDERKGWINRLAVRPDRRRKGIAKQLTGRIEERLRERGARIICVLVEEPNEASFRFFEKQGYIVNRSIIYLSKRESDEV